MVLTTSSPSDFRTNITHTLKRVAASPSAWFYAALWLASALVLGVGGAGLSVAVSLLVGCVLLLLSLLVVGTSRPVPAAVALTGGARRRVWLQLGLVLVVIVLTAWNNLAFHHVLPPGSAIPGWTVLVDWLGRLGEQWFGTGLGSVVVNPVTYVVIPLVLLLLAGARPGDRPVDGSQAAGEFRI
ncbi:hypothetical protein [Arthrobacter sp. U41]|uniref:hypothetical protein n=1 Tax=Arthrobacter sp. U41 TaxID=1849032 RepID=UPI0008593C29|nr:hypothetical protein [Arthrobacter sp. U41]AOT02809.1 hypothetical protein ASPU41_05055 [Arthrobacter sp. U41]